MGRLEGKTAVVVGGAGGIGAATALRFVREGASVALIDRADSPLTRVVSEARGLAGASAIIDVAADLSLDESVEESFAIIGDAFDSVDVLVNSAGIRVPVGDVVDMPLSSWHAAIEVNLLGAVRCSKHAIPLMTRGQGSIVHVSSTWGLRGRPGWAAYDSTKAALLALTRDMACDHVAQGIRVNAVCPGPTLTGFHIAEFARQNGIDLADAENRLLQAGASNLMDRPAHPDEIANAVLFLASDESSFITGSVLRADGGIRPAPSGFAQPQSPERARAPAKHDSPSA